MVIFDRNESTNQRRLNVLLVDGPKIEEVPLKKLLKRLDGYLLGFYLVRKFYRINEYDDFLSNSFEMEILSDDREVFDLQLKETSADWKAVSRVGCMSFLLFDVAQNLICFTLC